MVKLQMIALSFAIGASVSGAVRAEFEPGPTGEVSIELDREGRIEQIVWGQSLAAESEAVRRAMEARLRGLTWRIAAPPAAARVATTVSISTRFETKGDKSVLHLSPHRAGVGYGKILPPKYPARSIRNMDQADVLAKVSVDGSGRATNIALQVQAKFPSHFEDSVRTALGEWQFVPEQVDGAAVSGVLWVPIRFSLRCSRGDRDFAFSPEILSGVVDVEGERALADLVEITGQRVGVAGGSPEIKDCEVTPQG